MVQLESERIGFFPVILTSGRLKAVDIMSEWRSPILKYSRTHENGEKKP